MSKRSPSTRSLRRLGQRILLGCLLGAAAGCDLSNLFADEFLTGIGQDVVGPTASTGTVIVTVTNNTQFFAEMNFTTQPDALRVPEGTAGRNFLRIGMPSGSTDNSVFDCPLDRVTPGRLADAGPAVAVGGDDGDGGGGGGGTPEAAVVFTTAVGDGGGAEVTEVEVSYLGASIDSGRDFQCGDVIAISVAPVPPEPGSDEPEFRIFVQVIPGA